jgi:DNA-binding MarR family transcriptional regulator
MDTRTAPDPLDEQLCFALYRASRAMTRVYLPVLSDLKLTYPQYLAMLVLWEAESPQSVGDIRTRLRLDTGTLTPLLKRIEELGYIDRDRDPADERRVIVALTQKGKDLRAPAAEVPGRVAKLHQIEAEVSDGLIGELSRIADILEGSRHSS